MDTYTEECLKAKRVKEGIVTQREVVRGKKKKKYKPWAVYCSWHMSVQSKYCYLHYFETEQEAIKQAEKLRRIFVRPGERERVWVANSEGRR